VRRSLLPTTKVPELFLGVSDELIERAKHAPVQGHSSKALVVSDPLAQLSGCQHVFHAPASLHPRLAALIYLNDLRSARRFGAAATRTAPGTASPLLIDENDEKPSAAHAVD